MLKIKIGKQEYLLTSFEINRLQKVITVTFEVDQAFEHPTEITNIEFADFKKQIRVFNLNISVNWLHVYEVNLSGYY